MRCSCDAMRVNAKVSGLYLIGGIHIGSQISMAGGVAKTRVEPEVEPGSSQTEHDGARRRQTCADMLAMPRRSPTTPGGVPREH